MHPPPAPSAGLSSTRGIYYLVFIVQSQTSPAEVTQRVHTFLEGVPQRIANTSAATFSGLVDAARQYMLEPPTRLAQVASEAWDAITDDTHRFGWTKSVANALSNATLQDVLELWDGRCSLPGAGRVLVQVFAQGGAASSAAHTPTGYMRLSSPREFRNTAVYWD